MWIVYPAQGHRCGLYRATVVASDLFTLIDDSRIDADYYKLEHVRKAMYYFQAV